MYSVLLIEHDNPNMLTGKVVDNWQFENMHDAITFARNHPDATTGPRCYDIAR